MLPKYISMQGLKYWNWNWDQQYWLYHIDNIGTKLSGICVFATSKTGKTLLVYCYCPIFKTLLKRFHSYLCLLTGKPAKCGLFDDNKLNINYQINQSINHIILK